MIKALLNSSAILLFALLTSITLTAQTAGSHSAGHAWFVRFILSAPGTAETQLKTRDTHWREVAEAAREQGLISDYFLLPFANAPESEKSSGLMFLIAADNYTTPGDIDKRINKLSESFTGMKIVQKQSLFLKMDMRSLFRQLLAQ